MHRHRISLCALPLVALLATACAYPTDTVASKRPAEVTSQASQKSQTTKAGSDKGKTTNAVRTPTAVRGGALYATRDDAMQFADDVAARRNLDREWVRATIGRARLLPNVPRLMLPAPSGTQKNWRVYRSRFIDPVRIAAGVRFWHANAATLERAEAEYGVPPEIIVGIIGVETIYGQNMGNFRVIDALSTLAFDFPSAHPRAAERQAFFAVNWKAS